MQVCYFYRSTADLSLMKEGRRKKDESLKHNVASDGSIAVVIGNPKPPIISLSLLLFLSLFSLSLSLSLAIALALYRFSYSSAKFPIMASHKVYCLPISKECNNPCGCYCYVNLQQTNLNI